MTCFRKSTLFSACVLGILLSGPASAQGVPNYDDDYDAPEIGDYDGEPNVPPPDVQEQQQAQAQMAQQRQANQDALQQAELEQQQRQAQYGTGIGGYGYNGYGYGYSGYYIDEDTINTGNGSVTQTQTFSNRANGFNAPMPANNGFNAMPPSNGAASPPPTNSIPLSQITKPLTINGH